MADETFVARRHLLDAAAMRDAGVGCACCDARSTPRCSLQRALAVALMLSCAGSALAAPLDRFAALRRLRMEPKDVEWMPPSFAPTSDGRAAALMQRKALEGTPPPPASGVPDDRFAPWNENWSNSVAICATMRQENVTDVAEWLAYHRCVRVPGHNFAFTTAGRWLPKAAPAAASPTHLRACAAYSGAVEPRGALSLAFVSQASQRW